MKMTNEERDAKVAVLKPAWAKEYILQLEDLTRELARRLREAQSGLAGVTEIADHARDELRQRDSEDQHQYQLQLTPDQAAIAWRALDAMDGAALDEGEDEVIAMVTAHFAKQLPPRPEEPEPHRHGNPAPGREPAMGFTTMRVLDGRNEMAPLMDLPDGAEIRIAGYFQVHYSEHEVTAGAHVLVVEGEGPLVVRAVDPGTIIVARG